MAKIDNVKVYGLEESIKAAKYPKSTNIESLNSELTEGINACMNCPTGQGHDNALKGIVVQFDLTFSNKAWVQAERYHFLDFVSSQSTMHKIAKFNFKQQCNRYVDDRIICIVQSKINEYNRLKEINPQNKEFPEMYLDILYNIPSGFELTARMTTNYQQLKTIYQQRRNHRLPDWQVFCDWIETLPRFMEMTQK